MNRLALLAPIVLPVAFWAWYHYRKDRHFPEPVSLLAVAFLLGLVAAGLSRGLYAGLGVVGLRFDAGWLADHDSLALFAYAMLAIGPVEELAKLLPFVLVMIRLRHFDEPIDGIVYASFTGLGYAAVENWLYLDYLTPWEAAARGFASPVVHMLFASIWGLLVARAHVAGRPLLPAAASGFAIAALLHGLYDFAVLLQPVSALPMATLLILGLWLRRLRTLRALAAATRSGQPRL